MSTPKKTTNDIGMPPGVLPTKTLCDQLQNFQTTHNLKGKGQIATMLFASRLARKTGLPFDIDAGITTEGEGQVKGLGVSSVQAILSDYKITKTLAKEGGRTSRGSLGNIRAYLAFLNSLGDEAQCDLAGVEAWWVDQARHFFNAKPFVLRFETGKSLRSVVRDLLGQARKRQDQSSGTKYVGAMLQHLIGAKLELALPDVAIGHNGFSVADDVSGRSGDFDIGNAAIHVTTAPGEAVMKKCRANLAAGKHPIVITINDMLPAADVFAATLGIADKVDILDAEQFIVANLHELGGFLSDKRQLTITSLLEKYNAIVEANETDPSLQIVRE